MSRLHGRNSAVYLDLTGAGAATPVPFLNKFTIDANVDDVEVTAFQDVNKTYVAGLPDAQGVASGYYDDATVQTYTAARDGVARKTYFYPNTGNTAQYWMTTALWDFNFDTGVAQGEQISSKWKATAALTKIG